MSRNGGAGSFWSVGEARRRAKRALPGFSFDFIDGGAADEISLRGSLSRLASMRWLPQVGVMESEPDFSVMLFGRKHSHPFGIGPTGLNGLLWPDADLALAKAAHAAGCPFVLATTAGVSIEEIGKAVPGGAWLQLYLFKQRAINWKMLERAQLSGFAGLVVTLDVALAGKRERDIKNGFSVPPAYSVRNFIEILRHPSWSWRTVRHGIPRMANIDIGSSDLSSLAEFVHRELDPYISWDDIREVRRRWSAPLVVKGILSVDDAIRAVEAGADGIVVSNHGGRQLDGAVSTVDVLEGISDAVGDRVTVMSDGGLRRGSDILKHVALGSRFTWLGRAVLYGVAVNGEKGAVDILDILSDELRQTMMLLGAADLGGLKQKLLME